MARKVSIKSAADIEMARKAGARWRRGAAGGGRARAARRHHRRAGPHLPRPHRQGAAGHPRQHRLPRLSQDHLRLAQPRHLPRHPVVQGAQERRHPEHRRGRHRTAGTATPAACTTSASPARWPAGWSAPPTKPCAPASWPSSQAPRWAISVTPSRRWRTASTSASCASTAATASARSITTSRRLHYGRPGEGLVLQPGMMFTIEPMINAGAGHAPDARRLDRSHWTVRCPRSGSTWWW